MSDAQPLWGPAALQAGLRAVGYTPEQVTAPQGGEFTVFDYTIEVGPQAGRSVRIGLQVPPDWPITPPGGPQVSPCLGHPDGAVHASSLGQGWEYWSRPAPDWAADRSVRGYLRHLRAVFARLGQEAAA